MSTPEKDKAEAMSKKAKKSGGRVPANSAAAGEQSSVDQRGNQNYDPHKQKSDKMKPHGGNVSKDTAPSGFQRGVDKNE